MAKQYPWTDFGFETGQPLTHGQQGFSYWVRRASDPPCQHSYVAKKLRRQGDDDRRALFFNEVQAMRALDHRGVAKLVETNADQHRDRSVELFLVTEAIVGTDLEQAVRSGEVNLLDAVRITLGVLDILHHSHARGVVHRDIKPCHVILRDNSPNDPVLIDFGIAYNQKFQPSGAGTKLDERRGNQFLIGPEHAPGDPPVNRSGVTDICQCLGLLFFALTKEYPRSLLDTNNKKPHQRCADAISKLELAPWQHERLAQLFDFGFEWEPTRRWHTIDIVAKRLNALLSEIEPSAAEFDIDLDAILVRARTSSRTARMADANRMAETLVQVFKTECQRVKDRTANVLNVRYHQSGGPFEKKLLSWVIALENKVDRMLSRAVQFAIAHDDGKLKVYFEPYTGNMAALPNNTRRTLGSYDLGSAECSDQVRPLIASFLKSCVEEVLGVE
jgi:serine/threonine protein kinase